MSNNGGAGTQYFSLRWNNHPVNLVSVFTDLYQAESLVDVSLAAEGRHVRAHKVVLSACSDYFQALFAANPCQHPIVILKDVVFEDLQAVVKFMYYGIVNVAADKLPGVLKTADALQIKGLEKSNDLLSPYLGSPRLLPVPPHHGRQPSTESLPEYLHRSRSEGGFFPHRAHSAESRGFSFDSGPLEISRHKRNLSPPGSPGKSVPAGSSYARKKFRHRSENESASTEDKLEERTKEDSKESSPCLERSPSHYSSSDTEHIAKKKRAMFQARKGGSDSAGSKSSDLHHSSSEGKSDKENKRHEYSFSSSQSISHSSDREETEVHVKDTLQVPVKDTLQVPGGLPHPRTLVRTVSASEIQPGALTTKFKRGRFLKRQQCQEATEESEASSGVTKSEPPPSPPAITVNSSALVKQRSQPLLPSQTYPPLAPHPSPPPPPPPPLPLLASVQEDSNRVAAAASPPPSSSASGSGPVSPKPATCRQPSIDPLCGLESVPLLYSSSGPGPRLTPTNLLRPSPLPSVRVIPEPEPAMHELLPHPYPQSIPSPSLLYPGASAPYDQVATTGPTLHHQEKKSALLKPPRHLDTPLSRPADQQPPGGPRHSADLMQMGGSSSTTAPGSTTRYPISPATTMEQFGHCPKARDGPALSCNYCWNTTDGSGRILRRKTKYHCPECQTNLCIVPCFQQFHEALESESSNPQQ